MRILFDMQQLTAQMTGVGHYTDRLLRAMLAVSGPHEWLLLCHSGNARLAEEMKKLSPSVREIVLNKPVSLHYQAQAGLLSALARDLKPDVYFSPCFLSAPRSACPTVVAIHDVTYVFHPEFYGNQGAEYLHRCVTYSCENAARIVTISNYSKGDIARVYNVPADRVHVTHLAADRSFFSPDDATKSAVLGMHGLKDRSYMLAVNMGSPKKNAATLFRAYARLPEELRRGHRLVVAGEWSANALDLDKLAREAGIREDVILTGYVPHENLRGLYSGAALFCFPSLHEGFGMPALEAMASGVPVLSSNAACMPEVIGDAGVLLDAHDDKAWAAAMVRLCSSERLRADLSRCGKLRAAQFSWEQTAHVTMDVLTAAAKRGCDPNRDVPCERSPAPKTLPADNCGTGPATSVLPQSQTVHPRPARSGFSIILPTFNDLACLKLFIEGVRRNSAFDHEIVIVSDGSTDGTYEYLSSVAGIVYAHLARNHGICTATNVAVSLASRQWLFLANADMAPAPRWDTELLKHLNDNTLVASTCIEPGLVPVSPIFHRADCGLDPTSFDWERLSRVADSLREDRTEPGANYPFCVARELWNRAGGLDRAFDPGPVSDPDLFYRLALLGAAFVRARASLLYHFSGVSLRRGSPGRWKAAEAVNLRYFHQKWGETARFAFGGMPQPGPAAKARFAARQLAASVSTTRALPRAEVSLVALLGDEAENVTAFLQRLAPHFDEVLLIEDGPQPASTVLVDQYVRSRREAHGASSGQTSIRVLRRPLGQDFAAQRNFAHENCRHEWVFHADLDEQFDAKLLDRLQGIIDAMKANGKSVCGFPRMNYLNGVLVNDLPRNEWTPEGLARVRDGVRTSPTRDLDVQFRLLRREVRWHRPVHEIPEPVAQTPAQVMVWPNACIRHVKSLDRQRRQNDRYESIAAGASLVPGRSSSARRPRVLMIATEYPPAQGYGLARYASELAAALADRGAEVHVVTCNDAGHATRGAIDGLHVHNDEAPLRIEHYDWVSDSVLRNIPLVERCMALADKHGPFDVILTHDWLAGLAGKALRSILAVPWVLVVHDTEVGKRDNHLTRPQVYIAEMEAWAVTHADAVVVANEFMRDEVVRVCKAPADRVEIVPCGLNPSPFDSATNLQDFRRLFAEDDESLIVYAGRLSPMKGIEDLVAAVGDLAARAPRLKLAIAGDGVLRESLSRTVESAGLRHRVFWCGWLSAKALGALYRVADVVAVPSRYEPFGMAAVEAAANGAAVVAAETGGLSGIVRAGDGAITGVPPRSPKALADAVARLLRDPDERRRKAEAGRDFVRRTYSWDRSAASYLALFSHLLKQRSTATERT
jgi:glycosyltransferase involved in cell wall biosynthesis